MSQMPYRTRSSHVGANLPDSNESTSRRPSQVLLSGLVEQYNDAKKTFQALPPKSSEATQAARFLRDTAENLIHYKRSLLPHNQSSCLPLLDESYRSRLVDELLETVAWTSDFVERASGGNKRSWERSEEQRKQIGARSVPFRVKKIRRGKGNAIRHGISPRH